MDKVCNQLFSNIGQQEDQIWTVQNERRDIAVSFPDEGHQLCYQVEESSFWFRHRNKVIYDVYRRFRPSQEEVVFLDIGGGNGFVSKGLQDQGVPAVLIEPVPLGALNATKRGVQNVLCALWEDLQVAANANFDVGLFDVIEHLENPQVLLHNLFDKMKPGSYVFVTVPAYQWLWSHEDDLAGHFRRYSRKTLQEEMEKPGFKMVYMTGLFSFLPIPLFLLRALPYRLGKSQVATAQETAQIHGQRNRILDAILELEHRMIRSGSLPFGGSLLCVVQKPK